MPEVTQKELSGRELDAAVAEKLMGWRITPEPSGGFRVHNPQLGNSWVVDSPSLVQLDSDTSERLYGRYAMPAYSESIEAAMEVAEHMYAAHWSIEIYRSVVIDDDWLVEFHTVERGACNKYTAFAKLLPEAVCRAALKALGAE